MSESKDPSQASPTIFYDQSSSQTSVQTIKHAQTLQTSHEEHNSSSTDGDSNQTAFSMGASSAETIVKKKHKRDNSLGSSKEKHQNEEIKSHFAPSTVRLSNYSTSKFSAIRNFLFPSPLSPEKYKHKK
jgi:hypothetical protein